MIHSFVNKGKENLGLDDGYEGVIAVAEHIYGSFNLASMNNNSENTVVFTSGKPAVRI